MSMHRDSMVVAIKTADGKVLREDTLTDSKIPTVYLPFGSEYSILLKNQHSRHAVVSIEIDGTEVCPGQKLVIEPKGELNLERFVRSNEQGRRFKFVERNHPDVGDPDFGGNGGVKVTWQFEKEIKPVASSSVIIHDHHYHHDDYYYYPLRYCPPCRPGYWFGDYQVTYFTSQMGSGGSRNSSAQNFSSCNQTPGDGPTRVHTMSMGDAVRSCRAESAQPKSRSQCSTDQVGATVEGSVSNQQFRSVGVGELETETHEIVFRILAPKPREGKQPEPLTVDATRKLFCPICGHKVEFTDRFCKSCGVQQV